MMIYVQAAILGPLQKVISHKYTNGIVSYMMIYLQAAIVELLCKEERVEEKVELKMFHLNPRRGCLSTMHPDSCVFRGCQDTHLRLIKHFGERKFGESSIQSGTSG